MRSKYWFKKSNRTICDNGEILCFATLPVLNNKKNLKHFLNLSCLDKAETVGGFSDLHKIFKDFYLIDNVKLYSSENKQLLNEILNQSENLIRYIFIKVKNHQDLPTKLKDEKK